MNNTLARTPLYEEHIAAGGKMVPFAGFEMPVQYTAGALKEYHHVRHDGCGLFDISHMGQVRVQGPEALSFLQYVTTNDVTKLSKGQVQYSALLNETGTFIDDITTYKVSDDHYYLCINAANRHKDIAHLQREAAAFDVEVCDESDVTTLLALQGENAQQTLQPLVSTNLEQLGYYRFVTLTMDGHPFMISRTGYTGEDGFEIYLPNELALHWWRKLLKGGAQPVGLAARDMLRTEMGYALYGHEISDQVTPVEAKLMWITKLDKGDFIGRTAVMARREQGPQKRLIALKLTGRGIPREHYSIYVDSTRTGEVTSGMFSPMAGGIALAYVQPEHAENHMLYVEIRSKRIAAERTKTPFVRSRVRKS